jgi:hypothetical protein
MACAYGKIHASKKGCRGCEYFDWDDTEDGVNYRCNYKEEPEEESED